MKLDESLEYIKSRLDTEDISIAVVLGSGLTFSENEMKGLKTVSTSDIPGFPVSTVKGHKGTISTGRFNGKMVMVLAGRVHYYEGYNYEQVDFPVDLIHGSGVKKLLLTNAAGSMNEEYKPGSVIVLNNFIAPFKKEFRNATGSEFSSCMNNRLFEAGTSSGIEIHRGCYAYMTGPSFETPSEIEFLRNEGADVVGMSTVPEILRANELGIEVSAVSRVSNYAAGITGKSLSHNEVLSTSAASQSIFVSFLKEFLNKI